MQAENILYISIAAIVAFALAVFIYGYKSAYNTRLKWMLGTLRFLSLFAIFLLLINPKFKNETYTVVKPKLPILIDHSLSMAEMNATDSISQFISSLKENKALNDKFELRFFEFGDDLYPLDSLHFTASQTRIDKALQTIDELFKTETAPTIIVSDGNQTFGTDYEFAVNSYSNAIYPIVVGDSTQHTDLRIEQLNTNKYSFLKNDFPIEAILVYNGSEPVNSRFTISQNGNVVYAKEVSFTEAQNSKTISFSIPSKSVGLQRYTATVVPLSEEKNTTNNSKVFAVEVIDQATNIVLVSDIKHPDLGALKKGIETNEQRVVTILKPSEVLTKLNDYQLVVLYQPNTNFLALMPELERFKKNTLTITGLQTDWNFLNASQGLYSKNAASSSEEVTAQLNLNYGSYAVEDFGISDFPPLQTSFGDLTINAPHEVLLFQQIDGYDTGNSLFASTDINGKRDAIWDGEDLWRWRAQSYLNSESFQDFDEFIGKIVQYLASNKRRSRLEVSNETFYYNNLPMLVSAQYFDKNFVFDNRAQLEIQLQHQDTETQTVFPLLLKNNYYEVDLSSLEAGNYNFTVSVKDETVSRSGSFTILDFNVEQQFLSANLKKLKRLAARSGGSYSLLSNPNSLISNLITNEAFKPIQKPIEKVVPLIDWKYLLILIALFLSAEWFIRKYNGLI